MGLVPLLKKKIQTKISERAPLLLPPGKNIVSKPSPDTEFAGFLIFDFSTSRFVKIFFFFTTYPIYGIFVKAEIYTNKAESVNYNVI